MGLWIFVFLAAAAMGTHGGSGATVRPQAATTPTHPNSLPEAEAEVEEAVEVIGLFNLLVPEEEEEDNEALAEVMATGELNPNHYPAQRAAKVVQHYLNTRHGSPYRVIQLSRVHSGNAEDEGNSGRKYKLQISVQEMISNKTDDCSAEVFFPTPEQQRPPQVQALSEELAKINVTAQEEALFQKYKATPALVSARLSDSFGHMEPDMKPLWQLGIVASSFIMLNQSTEDTLFNMAQVANVTQLETEDEQLKFDYHVLLHEMISQEILHWKLLFTWSPQEGVKVLQMEQLPHSHHLEETTNTD